MPLAPSVHESVVRWLSHALRHDPSSHLLEVDCDGWALLGEVLLAIRCERAHLRRFGKRELEEVVRATLPRRFEIVGDRIRALYGHSLPTVEAGLERTPPTILFHGTTESAWCEIAQSSLRPQGRKFVHLTDDRNYAENVARSKSAGSRVLITVAAQNAYCAGVRFLQANEHVWLTPAIEAQFLSAVIEQASIQKTSDARPSVESELKNEHHTIH